MPPHTSPRVITLGETMILITPTTAVPLESAADFRLDIGGAESNVATHLARLGHRVAWVSRVGDDALGHRLERLVRERGVDTTQVQFDQDAPTGVYFKDPGSGVLYYRRGSAASLMRPGILTPAMLQGAEIVHLSGITPALSTSCAELVDSVLTLVESTDTLLSFDVNYRAALWSIAEAAPVLLRLAQRADLVFVGLDEAETLWGTRTPAEVRSLLDAPRTLVIKDGDVGATEFAGHAAVFVPAHQTEVVEAVGAGDAFAAGYLGALLDGLDAEQRLTAGHERAVLVLQSMSDFVADPHPGERPPA